MFFDKYTFSLGGKVKVPHSLVEKQDYGEIVLVTPAGITVKYGTDEGKRICFYAYQFLNHHYGMNPATAGIEKGSDDLNDPLDDIGAPV